jgi:hypothetical protein
MNIPGGRRNGVINILKANIHHLDLIFTTYLIMKKKIFQDEDNRAL